MPTKVRLVKAVVFPVVMYGCKSWTIKKAECQRIDAFELWCWRKLLRVPWTARRSKQSILKEISPEYSLEGLMLKLRLPSMQETWVRFLGWEDPLEKGKATDHSILAKRIPGTVYSMGSQRVRHDLATCSFRQILMTSF